MLDRRAVNKYLEQIKEMKATHELIDMHVHPFEVLFKNQTYQRNPEHAGVYSTNNAQYGLPGISEINGLYTKPTNSCRELPHDAIRQKCLLLAMRKVYLHTGPQVFIDQMQLSGVDRVLLLPVSGEGIPMDEQMSMMAEMFGKNKRFVFGYSVPSDIANSQIGAAIEGAVRQYDIKAIKIHPAISDINLQKLDGLERVESILRVCQEHGLSVVIHGGKSPDIASVEKSGFGELNCLERVDWSLSGNPVVIAHAGVYGCSENIMESLVKSLGNIMIKHDNVMVDFSGIHFKNFEVLLNSVDPNRVVFGSDSLYYRQWESIVLLYHSLQQFFSNADEQFLKIASINPARILRGGVESCMN